MKTVIFTLLLISSPIEAAEFLANAPDFATFKSAAKAASCINTDGSIRIADTWQGRNGSWFLNYVGTQKGYSGVWARLRVNGTPDSNFATFLSTVAAQGVTVYQQIQSGNSMCWSSDGLACAVDQTIGQIGQIM